MYICSGYGFLFPACNDSANTTIHGLKECLIYHHVVPYTIASDQGAHFSKCDSGPVVMESICLALFPTILNELA